MSLWLHLPAWMGLSKRRKTPAPAPGPLREFVYLDDVSVHSLLASRTGNITTESTESETVSRDREARLALGVQGASAGLGTQGSRTQASQVLRKAIVQSSFKDLYEGERNALALEVSRDSVPTVTTIADLETRLESHSRDRWMVDPDRIHRGELLEAEAELEAEPIFHMAEVITTMRDILEENSSVFGSEVTSQVMEMQSIARVLDSLLAGLVPIRARLVDYSIARIGAREVLVHQALLDQLPADSQLEVQPVFIVGVTQRDLFWKDIRRVLFSKARYTVFCRLAARGLAATWRPVKVAEVLTAVAPQVDAAFQQFSKVAAQAMEEASGASFTQVNPSPESDVGAIQNYAALLSSHHGQALDAEAIETLLLDLRPEEGWLATVDGRRPVFAEVTCRVDRELGVVTPNDVAHDLRRVAVSSARVANTSAPLTPDEGEVPLPPSSGRERFLDTEVVAIYW